MLILCKHCGYRILVPDGAEADEFFSDDEWFHRYKCVRCKGPLSLKNENGVVDISLTAQEAHIALVGLGLPEELLCGAEEVKQLFTKPVSEVDVSDIPGTTRCVLNSITFEDGSVLCIATGGYGPTAYRIRRPKHVG